MAYTKHSWREKAGTTGALGERVTWMNNCETQYDEVVSYYTTTYHDTQFYKEAEMASTFFAPTYDGTGSGFVAETLDGYTAVQIYGSQVAAGTIAIWSASQASIPSGWHLCDGRDANTPDLRDRFPVAAGTSYARNATGGAAKVSPSASAVTIAGFTITTTELPAHTHSGLTDYPDNQTSGCEGNAGACAADQDTVTYTGYTGGGQSHTHAGSTLDASQGVAWNNLPAFKAYCYIVKE
jgi:hypothetical protein